MDTWTEPKTLIPNTEPNLGGVVLYCPWVWVAIYNSRVGIAFGSVVQTCKGCKHVERKGVGITNPKTHITFYRTIVHQIWIQVFKWDVAPLKEPQFWAVQS